MGWERGGGCAHANREGRARAHANGEQRGGACACERGEGGRVHVNGRGGDAHEPGKGGGMHTTGRARMRTGRRGCTHRGRRGVHTAGRACTRTGREAGRTRWGRHARERGGRQGAHTNGEGKGMVMHPPPVRVRTHHPLRACKRAPRLRAPPSFPVRVRPAPLCAYPPIPIRVTPPPVCVHTRPPPPQACTQGQCGPGPSPHSCSCTQPPHTEPVCLPPSPSLDLDKKSP
jgi:hypothetical protein